MPRESGGIHCEAADALAPAGDVDLGEGLEGHEHNKNNNSYPAELIAESPICEAMKPHKEILGYSSGPPDSAEGRAMARSTGRKTFYEDEGRWIIRGNELLRRLKKGAKAWNTFRWRNRRYRPSLSGARIPYSANFDAYNMSGGKFIGVDFSNVSFCNANLKSIDAKVSVFDQCDFSNADLTHANFFNVRFSLCTFKNAKLNDAFLVRSLFRHCQMDGADFALAEFGETDFLNVSLGGARGLSRVRHESPSYIDIATLAQSLPVTFLRGIGLSEEVIESQPLFGADASEYHSCFISFSAKDQKFADKLYRDLQVSGVRCWFAPHDLAIGAVTFDEIDRQITRLDKLVIILSKSSLASQWVEDEVLKAYAEERQRRESILVPVRLDDFPMKTKEAWAVKLRDQRNIGDFSGWKSPNGYAKSLTRLLSSLRRSKHSLD